MATKTRPIYAVYKKPTSDLKTQIDWKWEKNTFQANGKQKKAGVSILVSDKIYLKIKKITRDKEGHYIVIKGSIQEEDITIVNIYAPNIGAHQYIRQTLLLLSRFSRVWLFATPWSATFQVSPSMGFSRQEYRSWMPLPSPCWVHRCLQLLCFPLGLIPWSLCNVLPYLL